MPKIRELINFEPIKDVIDIDASFDAAEMVKNYIISPSLEEQLVYVFEDLQKSTHKAVQIVGGYGSGKSHMLAFIISILKQPELVKYIQNKKVRKAAAGIKREFVVIHWELQPNDVELSAYFYDRMALQLKEVYGIDYKEPDSSKVVDHKREILRLLELVKKDNPTRGLAVIIDEISDFLKEKPRGNIHRAIQFLRVLGQAAKECDFTFVGAMQELVFTSPTYIDQAESFGRVSERFNVITIRKEDIKEVIAKRVVAKTPEQLLELDNLFKEYTKYFSIVQTNKEDYIKLFPLHPYTIQIFSELPYFEKRGAIQFTIQEVSKILAEDFPYIITYDRIFAEIVSRHNIKNLDEVAPVVDAIKTLDSKIDLLEKRHQQTAKRIINAMAILKLYGKSTNNGATLDELANTLLILPANKLMEARDELAVVLRNLRRVTDGQFINKTEDGYYYLDLTLDIDYDQVIERRAENLPVGALDDEILRILKEQLLLAKSLGNGIFADGCRWPSRRSFREGIFVYERGRKNKQEIEAEYTIVFLSPFANRNPYKAGAGTIIISGRLKPDETALLKKTVAARSLLNENFHRSIMQKKYDALQKEFIASMVQAYLETGQVETGTETKNVKSLISREFSNFAELLAEIKPAILDEFFTSKYPEHPRFKQAISQDNIKGEFSSALKDMIAKGDFLELYSNTRSILDALDLVDKKGNISTTKSKVAIRIRQLARDNRGKNIDIKTIVDEFSHPPFGYDPMMTAFVFILLTYNGEINLKAAGGKTISSSEVAEVFGSGIDAFTNVRYFTLESDFDIQPVIDLFHALDLAPDKLRASVKRGVAVQQFRTRYLEMVEQIDTINNRLAKLSLYEGVPLDLEGLKTYHLQVETIPLDDFEQVRTPADFKKVVYEPKQITEIANSYQLLLELYRFYNLYIERLEKEIEYGLEIKKILVEHPFLIKSKTIDGYLNEAFAILADASRLLNIEELNPLLGKLEQAKKKYIAAYYMAHEQCVGGKVDWARLDDLLASTAFANLKSLKNVSVLNTHLFLKIESEIARIKRLRCSSLLLDLLEDRVLCPYCSFPQGYGPVDVDQRIGELEEVLEKILRDWEKTIISELNNYRDNIRYLSSPEQELIIEIIESNTLPGYIPAGLAVALNNLFKELTIIELDPKQIAREIFSASAVLDYNAFTQRLEDFKRNLIAGKDPDKIRIMYFLGGDNSEKTG